MKKFLSILLAALLLGSFGAVAASAVDYMITFHEGENPMGITTDNMPAAIPKDYYLETTLPTQIPLRADYKFKGWAASPTLSPGQKVYAAGEKYNSDETQDLYAIWEDNVCWITINGNPPFTGAVVTGLPAVNPVKKLKDTLLAMSTVGTPACDNYTFKGWARNAAGPVTISTTGMIGDTADTTLYAIWEKDTYDVTFNANLPTGGYRLAAATPLPAKQDKSRIADLNLAPLGALTIELSSGDATTNYTFDGWATTPTGAPLAGNLYKTNADATLYAVWKGRPITVIYNANGGTGTMANSTLEYGKAAPLRANAYTYPLASFLGWATSQENADEGKKAYNNGDSATLRPADDEDGNPVSTVTLYALWQLPDKTALINKIKEVDELKPWKYTAETWATLQKFLNDGGVMNGVTVRAARAVVLDPNATKQDIDNAYSALNRAQKDLEAEKLVGLGSLTTRYKSSIPNWLLFIFAFGWIWMWFGN